ncbi:GDSL esterase/lipase-like [Dorcoceras hygrometricum]|uniref:GDSL esterase/lipase-like n=1 Tax=Dorcoceras hygrometricum TaxID=472368 RepID=A0A2Z7CDD4_9LAMI|nr:GDSL esterase/lipase-like [Dorcoceras hygrometricum]
MASEKETFSLTGPTFLTSFVDWNNSNHRRSIAASLVQGVYILERDRHQNRKPPQALAPPWWESFHFLVDDHDLSIFGAIYKFKFPPPNYTYPGLNPPRFVLTFRGPINSSSSRAEDLKLNLHCMINNLESSTRFRIGMETTQEIVTKFGLANVWIAGHSVGSSIGLLIGRQMAKKMGIRLESYLFNPPFASPPIEKIKNEKVKLGLRVANSVITAGLAVAANGGKLPSKDPVNDPFLVLSTWVPYLFINSGDTVCSEYVGYFEHREKMEQIGAGKIGRLATKHSIGSIVSGARGKDSDAAHLIPSAYLTINSSSSMGLKESHGIHQWWRQDLELKYKLYQYKEKHAH